MSAGVRDTRLMAEVAVREAERRLAEQITAWQESQGSGICDDAAHSDAVALAEIRLRQAQEQLHDLVRRRPPVDHEPPPDRPIRLLDEMTVGDLFAGRWRVPGRRPLLHGLRKRLYSEAMWRRYLYRITAEAS